MVWLPAVADDDVAPGVCVEALVGDEPVLLIRTPRGLFACAAYCPHKAMHLEEAEVEGDKLTCPLHAATFDLATGTPEEETDWAGRLPVFATRVTDGTIEVDVPEPDSEE